LRNRSLGFDRIKLPLHPFGIQSLCIEMEERFTK
jgi:hypothetical protein